MRLPVSLVRLPGAIWQRCTPDECSVGRPRPLQMLKSLLPRRRPLALLRNSECSEGIYKVERQGGKRLLRLFPVVPQEQCTMEEAMDMF